MRWALGLAMTVVAIAHLLGVFSTDLVPRIDQFIYDQRMGITPPALDKRIVIVTVDEKSLAEVGRWPWGRHVIADMVDQLFKRYQIKALGFDVTFSEPDTSSGYATLATLVGSELKDIPSLSQRLQALKPVLDYDGRLAKAFAGRPVVLGYFMSDQLNKGLAPPPAFLATELGGNPVNAYIAKGYEANLPQLQQAARAGGFFNTSFDDDGLLRSTPLLMRVGDAYYESLSLALARQAMGMEKISPVFNQDAGLREQGVLSGLQISGANRQVVIPVENLSNVRIEYRSKGGPESGAFRYVSAVEVLKGRAPPEILKDAIVLVGTTAPGLNDMRATPVKADYPGVEVHANLVASMLDNTFKQQPDYAVGLYLLELLVVGILLTVVLSMAGPVTSILFSLVVAIMVATYNSWMYFSQNLIMPLALVLLLIASLFVFNIAWGYLFEFRRGKAIVNLFGEYVAPELVAEMAKDPASYSMEGESRELSVLFADVRGFTTISESMQPNELREYINLYLTAMSEDIQSNRGTLDKYIGDAVMAFWGAPVALADHAGRSVATALKMQASAARLNEDFKARNWPPLGIGIGINTGDMRVGDMGSRVRRAYTVMGDAVNLSSRLEGLTRVYGVGVIVGETTMRAAPEFVYRELDRVRVKGKNEPVAIFEPWGRAAELDAAARTAIEQWHQALAMVRGQQWEGAEQIILQLQQGDPDHDLFRLYLKSIAYYREHPPGADWDGVTNFSTK